jgi:cytochrome c oxidase subunit IV
MQEAWSGNMWATDTSNDSHADCRTHAVSILILIWTVGIVFSCCL